MIELNLLGDKIHTRTLLQKNESGDTEMLVLLTPEFIQRIQELEDKVKFLTNKIMGEITDKEIGY